MRQIFASDERREVKRVVREAPAVPGGPEGLLPWRQVVDPHPHLREGHYQEAEFAADLAEVIYGTAEPEYQDPVEFFKRTYLTDGMVGLLANAAQRLSGEGGDPVVQLQTVFGGGNEVDGPAALLRLGLSEPYPSAVLDESTPDLQDLPHQVDVVPLQAE